MEPAILFGGIGAAFAAGLGLRIGSRLIPVGLNASSYLKDWRNSPAGQSESQSTEFARQRTNLDHPIGRKRESSIVGIYGDVLRHIDGSYTRFFSVPLQETMLSHDRVAERRTDELARIFCIDKPPGTIMQFRYAVAPDPGRAIADHLRTRSFGRTYHPAGRLHDMGIDFYKSLADSNRFRREQALLSIRVPVKHTLDGAGKGINVLISALVNQVRELGFQSITSLPSILRKCCDDGVVRRLLTDEAESHQEAERIFRTVELQCPLSLQRLTRQQLWEVIYRGHNLDAPSVPRLTAFDGVDLRAYLCNETIEDRGWYVMHGSCPVSLVSLFTPPDPNVFADSFRALTAHPGLTFRHTLVSEFIYLDKAAAKKQLRTRGRQVERTMVDSTGRPRKDHEANASLRDLDRVQEHIAGTNETLVQTRFYALVYGEPANTRSELKESLILLDDRCEQIITALQSIDGAQAAREEASALHCLYPATIVGETDSRPTGREIMEVTRSLSAMIPIETAWSGSARPHTLLSTVSGRLTGLNLWDKSAHSNIKSPLVLILGEPGSGKTTTTARLINDALGTIPDLQVSAIDIGGSLAPHAQVVGARYLCLHPDDQRTINIWDSPELTEGEMPNQEQISLIVLDALILAHVKDDDENSGDLLAKAVTQVLKNWVPRNGPGKPKKEPTHKHLVDMLRSYDFGTNDLNDHAARLALRLEKYVGNPWLDRPTHSDFCITSPYDVYELNSLDGFPPEVRRSLANRIAARVILTIGRLRPDGTRAPTLQAFIEAWKLKQQYPDIMRVIQKGARTNRKENGVTIIETHGYEDLSDIYDITKTAGVKIIGKQSGSFASLIADSDLSDRAVGAINAINNVDGVHAQYVLVLGSGQSQQVEMIQIDLSPTELWTFTTNPDERNARARVQAVCSNWSLTDVIAWLASTYPRGLAAIGRIEVDESLLPFNAQNYGRDL